MTNAERFIKESCLNKKYINVFNLQSVLDDFEKWLMEVWANSPKNTARKSCDLVSLHNIRAETGEGMTKMSCVLCNRQVQVIPYELIEETGPNYYFCKTRGFFCLDCAPRE